MQQHGQSYAGDSESLQADVMRFMAIIAFCLIAILALVKEAAPTTAETDAVTQPRKELESKAVPQPVPEPPAEVSMPLLRKEVAAAEPEPAELPVIDPLPAAEPAQMDTPQPDAEQALQKAMQKAMQKTMEASSEAEKTPEPADEGLVLRFASDGDFLRLIARGDIRVYAFQDSDVLTLSESYRFLDSQSPGQVYELLPPSIPSLIIDALRQARADIDGFRWGIALPGHISNQIEGHLHRVTRGELVIDRYGDVHHVAAS
jgi:hypothetical protein